MIAVVQESDEQTAGYKSLSATAAESAAEDVQ